MEKIKNFVVLTIMMVTYTAFIACSTASDDLASPKKEEPTKDEPKKEDPDPEKPDTTKWSWNGLVRSDLTFDTTTEEVFAYNIGQISNPNRTVFDSIPLVYRLEVELKAPKRVVVESPDSTVLGNARTSTSPTFGEYVRTAKDSICSVSTGHTFPTQYYDISATTTSKRGYSLHAGHWEPFKYVTEKAQWSRIWHEEITEIVLNDSVFNREVVHNELTFVIKSNKGNTWYVSREEVVIVDHFKKIKESEEEKVTADDYLKGLLRFVSATKVYSPASRKWGDAYLFEGAESYKIYIKWYTAEDKYLEDQDTKTEVSFDVCPRSDQYNAVAYIRGGFYPGKISPNGKLWDIGCAINGVGESQAYGSNMDDIEGIKNFVDGTSATPSPYIAATPSERTVNGYKIISVTGKTSVHTSKVTIADLLLKK